MSQVVVAARPVSVVVMPTWAAALLGITIFLLIGGVIAALWLVIPIAQNGCGCNTGSEDSVSIADANANTNDLIFVERGGASEWTTDAERADKSRCDALFIPTTTTVPAPAAASSDNNTFTGPGVAAVPRPIGRRAAPFITTSASRNASSYVVILSRGSGAATREGILTRHGILPSTSSNTLSPVHGHSYSHAFHGFSVANLSRAGLERLRVDPDVGSIHQDGIVTIPVIHMSTSTTDCCSTGPVPPPSPPLHPDTQTIGWQVTRVGATRSSFDVGDGAAVVNADVYILDTGLPNHPDITSVVSAVTFVPGASSPADGNGHGTHVSGIVAAADNRFGVVGCAPSARLHIVQVLDASGSGAFSTVVAGVDYVLGQKQANPSIPVVANMSLGASVGTTAYNVLDFAVSQAISGGVCMLVAAGNSSGDARYFSPAHVTTAIAVGSLGQGNAFSSFSNYGPPVVLLGPGENVNSTWLGGTYKLLSGTSMATPAAASVAAAYLSENNNATPAQVKAALIAAAAAAGALSPPVTSVPASTGQRCAWMGSL